MSAKQMKKIIIDSIMAKFGKPSILFSILLIEKVNKNGVLEKTDYETLEHNQKDFYEQWLQKIHTDFKSGNSSKLCLHCFTYIKRGKMVSFFFFIICYN